MASDGVSQFKQPFLSLHRRPAQKHLGLNSHISNFLAADNFLNVDPQQLVFPILHSQAQRTDLPPGAAHRDDVYRTQFHSPHPRLFLFIIARLFVYGKRNFLVAGFKPV